MKSESPSVSVIVSCYNYADYIVECVESLLRQDYELIEVIVIDDGSTDGSLGLLREIHDSRLKIISQRNSGQAVAWNVGFEHSRGDFIFFCDADDYFYRNKISEVMRSIAPDVALYQHDLDEIDDVGARIGGATFGGFTSRTGCALLEGNLRVKIVTEFGWYFAPSSGLMIPRAIAAKIFPIPSVYSLCADVAVAYGASMRGDVKLIRASLGTYRLHSRSGYAAHFSNKLHWGVEQFINKMQRYHLIRQGIATRDFSDDLSLAMRSPLKNLSFRVDYLRQIEPNFWVCFTLLLGLRFRQLYGGRVEAHRFLAEVWRDVKALLPYRFYAKAQAIKKFRRRGMELFIASARSELLGGG
jgi:glycosyltransferase involved in cell wall biosynthesis